MLKSLLKTSVIVLLVCSCQLKKDWTCECNWPIGTTKKVILNASRAEAEKQCQPSSFCKLK